MHYSGEVLRGLGTMDDVHFFEGVLRCAAYPVCKRHFHEKLGYIDVNDVEETEIDRAVSGPLCYRHPDADYPVFMVVRRKDEELRYLCSVPGCIHTEPFAVESIFS